jgi:GNAT superfamily N-acetyltransferase
MEYNIITNGAVSPEEIEDLREAVGWERSEGIYRQVLERHYAYYTARAVNGKLIGYVSVLSDGIADAFLVDLMVHPEYQGSGLGKELVIRAVNDVKQAGVQCVQVTFDDHLEPFYTKCGFHIFKGGIIDFKHMEWEGD